MIGRYRDPQDAVIPKNQHKEHNARLELSPGYHS